VSWFTRESSELDQLEEIDEKDNDDKEDDNQGEEEYLKKESKINLHLSKTTLYKEIDRLESIFLSARNNK